MSKCMLPRLAIQKNEGDKPYFIHNFEDYEWWSKVNDKQLNWKLLFLPCGKCPACLENKSLEWTARLMKESEMWNYTYFITFTYDDAHLTDLNKRDLQLFLKRFRKATEIELKYYITGEYGETTARPHYHAIFFMNEPLLGLEFYANNLFTCKTLFDTWQNGQVLVSQDVNEQSIKYTIGYTLKKLGESKVTLMSKGLGLKYLKDKKEDIKFSKGFYLKNGFLVNPPSYFIRKLKESDDPDDIRFLEELENEPKSSVKVDWSIEELVRILLDKKESKKGKGVF